MGGEVDACDSRERRVKRRVVLRIAWARRERRTAQARRRAGRVEGCTHGGRQGGGAFGGREIGDEARGAQDERRTASAGVGCKALGQRIAL